ncbi:MAG TPA: hypothetical protein VL086_09060 [Candidatus Nitrosotalea sp.]|nr:hypothetical protein [Candidatus Nitrosotalea sp.]
MRASAVAAVVVALLGMGCATMTPEQQLRVDLLWEAARSCDHFGTLSVTGIDVEGTVSLRANADSRAEFRSFMECFREAVAVRIERRRHAGEPVPPELLREPTAEID